MCDRRAFNGVRFINHLCLRCFIKVSVLVFYRFVPTAETTYISTVDSIAIEMTTLSERTLSEPQTRLLSVVHVRLFPPRFVLGIVNGVTPVTRVCVHEVCGTLHVEQAMAYIDGETKVEMLCRTGQSSKWALKHIWLKNMRTP